VTTATVAIVAAPAVLLPAAYLVWWLDRFRLFPLARFLAIFALAVSVGLLVAARWPATAALGSGLAGPAMPAPGALAERSAVLAIDAARLALAALAVLVFLLARARVESPVDGVVFGVATGVGLALPAGWLLAESVPDVAAMAVLGQALAPVAVGAVVGLAVAFARFDPRWSVRIAVALGGTAAAVGVVTGARLAAEASRPWVAPLLLAAALVAAVAAAFAIELVISRRELAEEAALGVVPAWAPEVLPRYWRRVRGSWWPRRDERRALSRLLLQLAFRKHQLRHLDDDRATLYSLEVGRLRERARRLLDPSRTAANGVSEDE
jgi:hypothetical protein